MSKSSDKIDFARKLRKHQTDAEELLWFRLRGKRLNNIKFRRQQPIGNYIVDFVSYDHMLIVELDGGQHNEEKNKWKDKKRTEYLHTVGYKVIRFWDNDVLTNLDGVLEKIVLEI